MIKGSLLAETSLWVLSLGCTPRLGTFLFLIELASLRSPLCELNIGLSINYRHLLPASKENLKTQITMFGYAECKSKELQLWVTSVNTGRRYSQFT